MIQRPGLDMRKPMKSHTILYHDAFTATPLSFWVHTNLDHEIWMHATDFDPPLPKPVPGKGWPMLTVAHNGLDLAFASAQELHHFMQVIAQNPLPTADQLSKSRGTGLSTLHWLSRLPASAKSAPARKALFDYLIEIAPEFVEVA